MLRIKISLDKTMEENHFPIENGPILSEQVVKILNESDQFSGLYSISSLDLDKTEQSGQKLLHCGKSADFILSIFDFNLTVDDVLKLFKDRLFFLPQEYRVVYLKSLEAPEFKRIMSYQALSPISISHVREIDGRTEYFYPGDILFDDIFFDRLYNIHLLTGGQRLDISTCRYFQDSPLTKKKYAFKKGNKTREVKAFMQEFTIVAAPELQKILFFAGVGKLTEEGFGCVGVIDKY